MSGEALEHGHPAPALPADPNEEERRLRLLEQSDGYRRGRARPEEPTLPMELAA